ncbi:MAG: 4Fe-4S dicluster domain-containing protein [Planctomycetota bacterium]|jgi:ferredoxin
MKLIKRRIILQRALQATATVVGAIAAFTGTYGFLKRHRRMNYPVIPQPIGENNADLVVKPPGDDRTWNPQWSNRLIRPPGALEEDQFLAACIRCYRCQDACEVGAIQFFTEAQGRYYHTPYIDPAIKACNVCMKCTQVCPTNALRPMEIDEKDQVNMASVELREDLCLSFKAKRIRDQQFMLMELGQQPTETAAPTERRGPCGECYMFCPRREHAIKLEPGAFLAPIVYPDECVGCGMCEEICRVICRGEPAIRVVPIR